MLPLYVGLGFSSFCLFCQTVCVPERGLICLAASLSMESRVAQPKLKRADPAKNPRTPVIQADTDVYECAYNFLQIEAWSGCTEERETGR